MGVAQYSYCLYGSLGKILCSLVSTTGLFICGLVTDLLLMFVQMEFVSCCQFLSVIFAHLFILVFLVLFVHLTKCMRNTVGDCRG